MPAFRLTPQAQQDLLAIRHFTIEHWGQAQSRRYLEQLREVMHHLADMPEAVKLTSTIWAKRYAVFLTPAIGSTTATALPASPFSPFCIRRWCLTGICNNGCNFSYSKGH
ncbi:plasmid stabilization system protein [Serratia sp. SCBI]|nr:plasmid stabilization system protein [Serratia sp. SCBI]